MLDQAFSVHSVLAIHTHAQYLLHCTQCLKTIKIGHGMLLTVYIIYIHLCMC